ncbi:MAG: hypothetical protein ACJ739_07320 [Acidimicrobiales bacterium]
MRRWGPIIAIVAVAAIIAGLVIAGGGDDDEADDGGDKGPSEQATDVTNADGDPIYPFSWADGEASGLTDDLEWGDRCDTERGTVAIPDVSAAPCYLPFEGDNGGATEEGVTADTIKVVRYLAPEADPVVKYITDAVAVEDTNADQMDTQNKQFALLQTYFETYGRKVEVEYYQSQGLATDATTARADAVKIAEDLKPFLVLGGPILTQAFGEELAARHISCISCATGNQQQREDRAPYGIDVGLTNEQARAHNVEVLAKEVAGHKAEFAGDPELQGKERKFAYLHIETDDPSSADNAQKTIDAYKDAGIEMESVPYALDPSTLQETAVNAIARMKDAGVTTVVFAGDPVAPREFTKAATQQDYFPEWFLNISALVDTNAFSRSYDQEQWKHAFGLTALAARVKNENAGARYDYEWFYGEKAKADGYVEVIFPAPELLFTVLQEVGPNLTRQSFADALFRLEPTPDYLTAASVSWGQHDRWPGIEGDDWEGVDNIARIWWDPDATGPDELRKEGKGLWHFVEGGKRYLLGDWPEESFPAFDDEGTSTIYETTPESEAPPDYEPLAPATP